MELDRAGTTKQHDPSSPPPAETSSESSPSPTTNASPIVSEAGKRAEDHDSLVTVRLSEPPALQVNTNVMPSVLPSRKSLYGAEYTPSDAMAEAVQEEDEEGSTDGDDGEQPQLTPLPTNLVGRSLEDELHDNDGDTVLDEEEQPQQAYDTQGEAEEEAEPRGSSESDVNWDGLQRTEDQESKGQDTENSATMLLARLEQENSRLATNPKTAKVQVAEKKIVSPIRKTRPPSMAQLREMVTSPTAPVLRYSMLPPPPMTDLEFYAALVKDYQQTAARLPTLLSNKVRGGIPPPLRGVVWQSMSGARDPALEDMFDRLSGESSPYEGIIGKDLGRSFPGVDMFRDPEGEGQRMLGRVLKCFSLYDQKIGYCQGLAFLVGPLLMHMPDKQAFCVLVRLMEHYDLRGCFLPDLSGLHIRIYQFRELLRQHLPELAAHLEDLQVDPAYVSQWFLSFFAVTCPLPMLFRIYDVVFAEGASVTVMRVALSLMRKNQGRVLACAELEDAMQLLLSRGLWDCYHYNADGFVSDFVGQSALVTREKLASLEQDFRLAQLAAAGSGGSTVGPNNIIAGANNKSGNFGANLPKSTDAATTSDVSKAASRFLGRLWASSSTPKLASFSQVHNPNNNHHHNHQQQHHHASLVSSTSSTSTLSPGLTAPPRPLSMLRRSASKQSLASTLNSMEAGPASTASSAASVLSSASTDATSISRDSDSSTRGTTAAGGASFKPVLTSSSTGNSAKDDARHLHGQIEDLLTALSELQRSHTLLADQLQREREERDEDKKAVRSLLDGLRKRAGSAASSALNGSSSRDSEETVTASRDATSNGNAFPATGQLSELLDTVEQRFGGEVDNRRSSIPQTKGQLRDELARTKEQLSNEFAKAQGYNRRIYDLEQEVATTKDQLKESHVHVRTLHQDKQRLEKQIQTLKVRASDVPPPSTTSAGGAEAAGDWFSRAIGMSGVGGSLAQPPAAGAGGGGGGGGKPGGGLRELKLGRSKSTPSQAFGGGKRMSSLTIHAAGSAHDLAGSSSPINEHDALLLELVQAKTAEAIARQEAEEAKQSLRKALGLAPGENATVASQASAAASAALGMFNRLTNSTGADAAAAAAGKQVPAVAVNPPPATATAGGGGGGFWGWRR